MIHVYTGDGKGKTTAAIGLAVRFAGSGKRVAIFQFLKDGTSSELCVLKNANITVTPCQTETKGFIWNMSEQEKESLKEETCKNFCLAKEQAENYDMIVLDELAGVIDDGLVKLAEVVEFLNTCRKEIVITGRNVPEEIIKMADYVSEIKCIKHPFQCGVGAKKGIEY